MKRFIDFIFKKKEFKQCEKVCDKSGEYNVCVKGHGHKGTHMTANGKIWFS